MIKDYDPIFECGVVSMITTPNKKWLFFASYGGHLKQISLETQQVVHDYRQIHGHQIQGHQITCLETT